MTYYLMECGHVAQGMRGWKKSPVCLVCMCDAVAREVTGTDGLLGREAVCSYFGSRTRSGICQGKTESSWDLAFFEYRPDEKFDRFYCGCWGWD